MNKSLLEAIASKAVSDYKNAPYYIQGGKPRFLRLQSDSDMWFIEPDFIQFTDTAASMKLFKVSGFEIANIIELNILLPYQSIHSILTITYDDSNDFGSYNATVIRVSDHILPILKPY